MGNETVFLLLFPKGTCPRPQPAQPVGGPLRAFQCEGRRPGTKKEVQPPPTQPHQRRGSRGRNLLPRGFFPPFLPKKWGPGRAGQGSLPFQRRRRNPTTPPHPGIPRSRPFQPRRETPHHPPLPQKRGLFFSPFWALSHPPLTSLPVSGTMANIVSDRGSVNGYDGKL